ncbi:glucocorticoid receptor-like isoform X2 [Carassius carassius]|uniref:glucocorticoid receptor-like isoform X2 n=1 Tax=Carassius carassius TaxID=217509 RepID=UPI002868C965|nr:glucocorticoid receptor-like isoform X2 [Carassius carassius]
MDSGQKRSSNGAENLTFGDCIERGFMPDIDIDIGVSASALNTSKEFSNGQRGSDAQRNLSLADPSLMGRNIQEPDVKGFRPFKMQHQQKVKEPLNIGENFSLLDESIADLNRGSGIQASDTFAMKMEQFSPQEKDGMDFPSYGHPNKELDVNERVIGDNTIDILKDLDFTDSLSELNELYVADEAAFLSSLAVDETLLGESNFLKDTSPVVTGSSAACANVNGTGKRQQMVEASVNIKTEKDTDFIQLCTPGVIKQESERRSYCQMSGMGGLHGGPAALGDMGGQGYHYGANTASAVSLPDQKPPFGLFSPLHTLSDGWGRGNGYGDPSGMQRANETVLPSTYPYSRAAEDIDFLHFLALPEGTPPGMQWNC